MCAAVRLSEAERKKEIMNSAIKVISEKGLDKATMEEIILGTTMSKGGVYHYYGSVIEIFKDIMISGIEYRNEIIREHLDECKNPCMDEFIAKQMVDKILDNNEMMAIYVEFLIAKKRNPELNSLMMDLQEQTRNSIKSLISETPEWIIEDDNFQFITEVINSLILSVNTLELKGSFEKNRKILENIFILIFNSLKEKKNESL